MNLRGRIAAGAPAGYSITLSAVPAIMADVSRKTFWRIT